MYRIHITLSISRAGGGGVKCLLSMNVSNLNILKEIKKNDQEEREKY